MPSTINDRLDGISTSVALKAPCQAVATTNITLSGEQTVGGVAVVAVNAAGRPDRVACTGQTNPVENGIWDVSTGAWSRSKDFNGNRDVVQGTLVEVYRAAGLSPFYRVTSANPVLIGTDNITFEQVDIDADVLRADLAIDDDITKGADLIGYRGRTVHDRLDDLPCVLDYASVQAFVDAVGNGGVGLVPSGTETEFTSLTLPATIEFIGGGTLSGPAPSGSKPTRASLKGAANSAARLTLLDAYYNATVTMGSSCNLNGHVKFKNCLVVGGSSNYVQVRDYLELDDVGFHDVGLNTVGKGYVESTSGCILSDTPAFSVYMLRGGTFYLPDCIITHGNDEGIYFNTGGNCVIDAGYVDNCNGAGALSNYGGNLTSLNATFDSNVGYGVAAESGGQMYVQGATITNNGGGIFATRPSTVQAQASTITGNTLFAVDCRSNAVVDVLTATIDLTNNSGGVQCRALNGGVVLAEEPGVGSGKTALTAASYDPPWNVDGPGGSFIGETDPTQPGSEIGSIYPKIIATTIVGGALSISGYVNSVETEGAAASDDVDSISFSHGLNSMAVVYPVADTRTVVIKHGTGNITTSTAADITLDTANKGAIVTRVGTAVYAIPLF